MKAITNLRPHGKSFFETVGGTKTQCDYWRNIEYNTRDKLEKNASEKLHLQIDSNDGSVLNGSREPLLFSFAADELPRFPIFEGPNY